MLKRYLLTAGGVDRKGIVYNLTKILKEYDFNIEDSSMMMLRRTFSVIMLLSCKKTPNEARFGEAVIDFMNRFQMTIDIREITEKEMKEYRAEGGTYMISISGADKPGIVNTITEILFKNGANVIDLETKSSEKVKPHAYYMFLEVDIPKSKSIKPLEQKLAAAAKRLGVHVEVNRVETTAL